MKTFDPRIEWRDPATLTPYSNNAKTHPIEQIDKIAASIASFGFDQPIVVDGDGVIIKGHGRREASLRLGLDKVPVLVRDDLSVAEIKAARIADNKTAESPFRRGGAATRARSAHGARLRPQPDRVRPRGDRGAAGCGRARPGGADELGIAEPGHG